MGKKESRRWSRSWRRHTQESTWVLPSCAMYHPQGPHTHTLTASPCLHILPHALVEPTEDLSLSRFPASSRRPMAGPQTAMCVPWTGEREKRRHCQATPAEDQALVCPPLSPNTHMLTHLGKKSQNQILCEMGSGPCLKPRRNFRSVSGCGCVVEVVDSALVSRVSFVGCQGYHYARQMRKILPFSSP